MNSTSTTCQVEVYKDSFWMPIASSISYGMDVFVSACWVQTIWKDVMNPQTFWTIFKIFHAWIKGLVRTSFSKNLQDIHIFNCLNFQVAYYVCVNVALDLIQVWVPLSPEFCLMKNFHQNPVLMIISLSLSFITILKFYVLLTKSIPEMDESRVAKKAIFIISFTSLALSLIKFSGKTKPTYNQVLQNVT